MEHFGRRFFYFFFWLTLLMNVGFFFLFPKGLWSLLCFVPLWMLGWRDVFQKKHSLPRNFPILAHIRYLFEEIRPEIRQYFIESDLDGKPYNRLQRSIVYQRAKKELETVPFGSQKDFYAVGYEWVNHSLAPQAVQLCDMRVHVGGKRCQKPYSASLLNISAMSFGALSKNAVLALNAGAKLGHFAHNTGEGGLSPYHLEGGGDVIWQIGTGYFGCRTLDGHFDPASFAERSILDNVKMIEIKLSQGAKPGHGGVLPAAKVSREVAAIRLVPQGKDVLSPPAHSAFSTPKELMYFVEKLRTLSAGKPIGLKLCVGKRREFLALCKAMVETGIAPDYIQVDGGEGGTGAAPLEFADSIGTPAKEGLIFVHNALIGFDLRAQVKVISTGKICTGFDVISRLCMGADICGAARAFMLSLGCIQALKCHENTCPVGVATQDPTLFYGLDVTEKRVRVANFHHATLHSAAEILGAMGLKLPSDLRSWHLMRRVTPTEIKHYGQIYEYVTRGSFLQEPFPASYERAIRAASAETFAYSLPN